MRKHQKADRRAARKAGRASGRAWRGRARELLRSAQAGARRATRSGLGRLAAVRAAVEEGALEVAEAWSSAAAGMGSSHILCGIGSGVLPDLGYSAATFRAWETERDAGGKTPFMCAAMNGRDENVKMLLEASDAPLALLNQRDHRGNTALHYAARYGRVDTVELLGLLCGRVGGDGSMFDAVNAAGETPVFLAEAHGKADAAEQLRGMIAARDARAAHCAAAHP